VNAPVTLFGEQKPNSGERSMPLPRNAVVTVLLSLLVASTAAAALSPQYTEWRIGPAQWIMTNAEEKAWKQVKTDEEAIRFIDLFWARRDPTPGTPQNEARDAHNLRVKQADAKFAEKPKRGALTDRGRVWIVLGEPPSMTGDNKVLGASSSRVGTTVAPVPVTSVGGARGASPGGPGPTGFDVTGGRAMGARDVWVWEHEQASAAFGLPRVEIVFITDPGTNRTQRDVQRRDFGAAEGVTLRKQIVSPNLTELPDWAPAGGLDPKVRVSAAAVAAATQPKQILSTEVPMPMEPGPPNSASVPPISAAVTTPMPMGPAMAARGASRLVLSQDVYEIDGGSTTDPFAKLRSVDVFKKTDELGWAAQYCAQTDQEPTVGFTLRITGTAAGEVIDRSTPPDEIVPDRIKASPGCYMMRGAIPLEDMSPGKYTLEVLIKDPIVTSESYTLKRDFRIE
jgi:GWxTD domain-containing protein